MKLRLFAVSFLVRYIKLDSLSEGKGRFSKILVGIDGSAASLEASRYAIAIAKRYNSQLIAIFVLHLHGIRSVSSTFITAPTYGVSGVEEEKRAAQELLDRIKSEAHGVGVEVGTEIVGGPTSVEATIVEYAEREGVSLIVIGTRGRTGFKRLLLGSVALGVVKYSHCPVMVIK
jgi:nucleotide-binding universal stress UspA family protein